ncbi:hypothetical protein CLU79DRAFT_833641 [Phycomyces nitens]|nr:hypothetical protein CLU79DRAFT_833641 [Phycomyces nitens]
MYCQSHTIIIIILVILASVLRGAPLNPIIQDDLQLAYSDHVYYMENADASDLIRFDAHTNSFPPGFALE